MFKVGDKVRDVTRWEGVRTLEKSKASGYPLCVLGKGGYYTYTEDGKHSVDNYAPSLFHAEGYSYMYSPEPERLPDLAVDTKMLVRNNASDSEMRRYLSHFGENGECFCFMNGTTKYSSFDGAALWNFWKLYEGDE